MKKIKKIGWISFWLVFVGLIGYSYYQSQNTTFVYEKDTVVEYIEREIEEEGLPPVMGRIAECESGNRHYGESGQVLMMGNTNKSVDVGRYQINTLWFATAAEMGLDLTDEKENEEFAIWLYRNYGTEPWVWSKKCWNK